MSATRLLILGAVKTFQPAHGYLLRKELESWRVDLWANIKPGSIYHALKALTREGFLAETAMPAEGKGTIQAMYELTPAGQEEFDRLLREGLTEIDVSSNTNLRAAMSFLLLLPRAEAVTLLTRRLDELDGFVRAALASLDFVAEGLAPPHVAEHFRFDEYRLEAERSWLRGLIGRVQDGAYAFLGEPRDWTPPASDPGWALHRDRERILRGDGDSTPGEE